jgi:anti-sigma factor RsiW
MNTDMNTANENGRTEIEDLLPWHAAGTLSAREALWVEAALARDPELKRRYELVREELAQTIHLNESLGAPSARAMTELFAKIDAEPARHAAPSLNLGARIRDFFDSLSPRTLAWSAGAAALAIVLQAAVIGGIVLKEQNAGYQTASVPGTASREGSFALIRFQPQASAADITRFLESNKLSIAGGPAAGGLYRVRIAETKLPKADLDRRMQTLQSDKIIGFIAPTE